MKILLTILFAATMACSRSAPVAGAPKEALPTAVAAVAPAPPPPEPTAHPPPVVVTLPAGRSLRLRTTSTLSTKTAQSGEAFSAVLASPLIVDGVTIARAGANVQGVVAVSNPGGRVKGVASISLRATRLELASGRTVDLLTSSYVKAAPHTKKKDALKIGIGSGIGAAIGAIAGGGKGAAIGAGAGAGAGTGTVLATRGDPAVIPAESLLTLTLRRAITVTR